MAPSGSERLALEAARGRARHLKLVAALIIFAIVTRLGWLQLARGGFYRGLSEDNYVQGFEVRAPRGLILDRNGEILADNRLSLSITLSRKRGRDDERIADALAGLLELDRAVVAEKLKEAASRYYGTVVLVEDADMEQVSRIEERRSELPGVKVEATAARRYLEGPLAGHALGYVGEISERELKSMEPLGYSAGDQIGKSGVERRYEILLRGRDGAQYWVCDSSGRELYPFAGAASREARPGSNVVVALDAPAQRVAEERLAEFQAGAVVALDPSTGEILVMASHPCPDPNALVGGLSSEEWGELSSSPAHPLINRTIQATYPPGSQFKLITAAVGLDTRTIDRSSRITCRGTYKYGIRTFRCWRPEGHGSVDLPNAIIESCDTYFYSLGAKLGVATLMDWTERCSLGRATGIDIAGEQDGNVPTPAWYDRHYGRRRWSKGVVINLSIGQGELLVTPLQAACFVCGIVNDGTVYTPHVFERAETYSGRVIATARAAVAYELPFSQQTIRFLRRSMVGVVQAPNGTGKQARVPGIEVGGKTGTSQNPHGEDHAWFVAFAPADAPRIVIAVLVENGGSGGAVAAPIAREVLKAYLRVEDSPARREAAPPPEGAPPEDADKPGEEALGQEAA
jgi:penicillin-binding protein 2